jgi:ubiquinone/menaquinone biosynthesis C-methylase UbiE
MGWFRKSGDRDALPVTMTAVKLGDRFLSIGVRDPRLIAALATKSGLTGQACASDADKARADRGAAEIHQEGALVDVTHAPWHALPYAEAAFDVALVRDVVAALPIEEVRRLASEALRVLRGGGRLVVIEDARSVRDANALTQALRDAGFAAVRVLAEAEKLLFVEGIKSAGRS